MGELPIRKLNEHSVRMRPSVTSISTEVSLTYQPASIEIRSIRYLSEHPGGFLSGRFGGVKEWEKYLREKLAV